MRSGRKEALFLASVFVLAVMAVSLASAAIVITPTKSLYSIGDDFDVNIAVKSAQDTNNFFVVALICEGRTSEFYRSPLKIAGGEEKTISISTSLDNFLIAGVGGDCLIRADYGDETVSGKTFKISGNVEVELEIDVLNYEPGEIVSVGGTATKSNGEALNGFVELSVSGVGFSETIAVTNGAFTTDFVIPEDAAAESYEILAVAYEQNEDESITNTGQTTGKIKVAQVIKEVEVALGVESIAPENELIYSVVVYDQAGQFVEGEATVIITDSAGFERRKELVKTSESSSLFIESNFTPGDWKIYAKVGEVETTRKFEVREYKKVSFELEDRVLSVTNVGNVLYSGPIQIKIGSVNEIKDLNLEVGAVKKYRLVAPDGDYEIEVSTGGESANLGRALLTGNAISVEDVGGALGNNLFVIVMLIIVLAALVVVIYFYRKKKKNQFIGKTSGSFTPTKFDPAEKDGVKKAGVGPNVIDRGEKQESVVVALNIKNLSELQSSGSEGLKAIDSALWKAKESGAKIYSDEGYRVIVLAPVLTKEKDISVKGLRVAEDLERRLSEFNRRMKAGIDFGIGVNIGELIVEATGGDKFRFISLDNTISAAKRISGDAKEEVLLTEKARRKSAGKIKVKKKGAAYKLYKITDRSAHADYISKFKARQKASAVKGKK